MMRVVSSYRLLSEGTQFRLTPRSSALNVPVLAILASPFSKILEPPSLEHLMDFFDAHPQGDERAHSHIKIGVFSPPHRLFPKIVLHNL
jgi:hypothetical protein